MDQWTIDQIREFVKKDYQSVAARMTKCMLKYYDEAIKHKDVNGASASEIATDFIEEMMRDEHEPKALGHTHPVTEDILLEWFTQIGIRNGNVR